jgi:hypothetical protein
MTIWMSHPKHPAAAKGIINIITNHNGPRSICYGSRHDALNQVQLRIGMTEILQLQIFKICRFN